MTDIFYKKVWAMPSHKTFSIKPIKELVEKYCIDRTKIVLDPFANDSKFGTITNDLDPQYNTDYHLDALDFLKTFNSEYADVILYDPPYSSRQTSECYKALGRTVNMETTQGSFWRKLKEEITRVIKPNGIVLSFGWQSGGIGKKLGFEFVEGLLVAHGGIHNDTIITVERKLNENNR